MTRVRAWTLAVALAALPGCAAHTPPSATPASRGTAAATATKETRALQADLLRVFTAPIMSRGVWAVDVRSLDSNQSLFSLNADKLMMPASNMKILTLASAAEALGWDFRFTTALETTAPVVDGTLQGDLIVRGTGDPTINTRGRRAEAVLDEWATALKAAGVTTIEGRIVGDDQAFDDDGVGPGWAWDYLQYGYAAPVGALEFNENVATLTVLPGTAGGDPAIVTLTGGSGFSILNRAVTGPASSPETIDYKRHIDRPLLEITGSVPLVSGENTRTVNRTVAVINPTIFFVQQVKEGLAARGIRITGEAADFDDVAAGMLNGSPERRTLVTTQSPPLSEMATVLMKVSQNLYAETFLKALASKSGGLGTWAAGRRAARATLTAWGVPEDAYVMSDGSGLSRYNYVTARTITTVLERMYKDPRHKDPFIATLPIAGKDGTISTRMRRSLAEGNAVAKTGSIANVRALSGYVRTRDGEMLVFSILTNDFVIPSATVNWIADLGVEILASFSRAR